MHKLECSNQRGGRVWWTTADNWAGEMEGRGAKMGQKRKRENGAS